MIALRSVKSSKLAALAYSEDDFALYVLFPPSKKDPHGSLYAYDNVPAEVYEEFATAPSLGKYFGANIQYNRDYPYKRLELVDVTLDGNPFPPSDPAAPADPEPQQGSLLVMPSPAAVAETEIPDDTDELVLFADAAKESLRTLTKSGLLKGVIVISTPEEFSLVGDQAMKLARLRKAAAEKVAPGVQEKHAAWKAAVAARDAIDSPFVQAIKMCDDGMAEYRRQERARAAEAQRIADDYAKRAAQEDADRRAREQAEAQAATLKARGDTVGAVAVLEHPAPVAVITPHVAPVHAAQIPVVAGQSVSQKWSFEVIDERLVPCTPEFWSLDETKLRGYAGRLKQHASVPGVRFFPEDVTRRRTGGR